MLQIVFFILKLILFLVLAAAAIILAVFLSVLLAPLRYQIETSLHERFSADGRISWLFRLVTCSFSYGEEGLKTKFGILWFHPFQEKEGVESERTEESRGSDTLDEEFVTAMENQTEKAEDSEVFPGPTEFSAPEQEQKTPVKQKDSFQGKTQSKEETSHVPSGAPEREKKRRKGMLQQAAEKAEQIKKCFSLAVRRVRKNILNLKQKKDSLSALLSDEKNKKTFRLLMNEVKRLVRKLFPKIKGSVAFGVEDPYLMGQLLTVLAVFYPLYGGNLETEAVFNENVLEGDVSVKGKLCLGTFAVSGLRIWRDKNFRALMKRFLREGGV